MTWLDPAQLRIGLGCMRLTGDPAGPATIRAALDAGVTLLDTADVYAPDEGAIGAGERLVAEVTDAARARLLELAGYDVQVVEFVALEHTSKNVLLRARRTKRPRRDRARLAAEYRTFADALQIEPTLERLLADMLPPVR